MKQWGRVAALAALAAGMAVGAGAARAQEKPAGGDFDPKVKALLDQSQAAYKALDALHVKATGTVVASEPANVDFPRSVELRYQKPNRIYLFSAKQKPNGLARRLVVCDGTTLWRWESATNTYTKAKAPASLHGYTGLPDDLPDVDLLLSGKNDLADIPNKSLLTLAQPEKLGGVDVDVLSAKVAAPGASFSLDLRLLFGQSDHLLHGVTADASGKNQKTGRDETVHVRLIYDLVDPMPHFTAADFTFTPPPGAKLAGAPQPAAKPAPVASRHKRGARK